MMIFLFCFLVSLLCFFSSVFKIALQNYRCGNCIYNSFSCLSPDVCFVKDIVCCDSSGTLVPHSHRQVGTLFQKLGKRPALLCSWSLCAVHVYRQTYYYLTCTVFSRRLSRLICKPFGPGLGAFALSGRIGYLLSPA